MGDRFGPKESDRYGKVIWKCGQLESCYCMCVYTYIYSHMYHIYERIYVIITYYATIKIWKGRLVITMVTICIEKCNTVWWRHLNPRCFNRMSTSGSYTGGLI